MAQYDPPDMCNGQLSVCLNCRVAAILPPTPLYTQVSLLHRREVMRKEHRVLLGLHELLTYGLKGVAAYAHHAEMLGKVDPDLDNMFEEVRREKKEVCSAGFLALRCARKVGEILTHANC